MIIKIDTTVTPEALKQTLDSMKANRTKYRKPRLAEFFGALTNIGDGLEFQKSVRDEWD
jgi:hypothetical protein